MKKSIFKLLSGVIAVTALFACQKNENSLPFGIDTESIVSFAEGGSFEVALNSSDAWMVSTDNPWISISPANGSESAKCMVSIDSTVLSSSRNGLIRFKNRVTNENRDIQVTQAGYGYNISLQEKDLELKNSDKLSNREFEVKVLTNVPFKVSIPSSANSWLKCEQPEFNFDRGARPREVTVKFKWGVNSMPIERIADVQFEPLSGWSVESADVFSVKQKAAPKIEIGHAGDSIAVISIANDLDMWWYKFDSSDEMKNWDNITLWEEFDEGYTPEKAGRVKKATFSYFDITEELPYAVQYLTEAEELTFFSNVNSFLYDLDMGENICKLPNLKKLTVSAYGLTSVPESIKELKSLEYLNLSGNNFDEIPEVINPENLPNLTTLVLNTCQRSYILDLSNTISKKLGGFHGEFPRRLFEWEKLESLVLSVNYLQGEIPDMLDYPVKYTAEDCQEMNLPEAMIGTPKVLPNAKLLTLNLNRFHGKVPDWILYHPNLVDWEPYSLIYPQEGRSSDGILAGFSNVPINMDYYWNFYEGFKEHKDIYIGD